MTYGLIDEMQTKATPVAQACRVLGVSRYGFIHARQFNPTAPNVAYLSDITYSMAIQQRRPSPGLIAHSDRGSQYASDQYQALLAEHGFVYSMSRKGNCWDNAVAERFFLNLKMERVWQCDYANHAEARNDPNSTH